MTWEPDVKRKVKPGTPVTFEAQPWLSFNTLPNDDFFGGNGPSNIHLWIYFPEDTDIPGNGYVTCWSNWSGNPSDIKHLKKQKAMWCYKRPPVKPI